MTPLGCWEDVSASERIGRRNNDGMIHWQRPRRQDRCQLVDGAVLGDGICGDHQRLAGCRRVGMRPRARHTQSAQPVRPILKPCEKLGNDPRTRDGGRRSAAAAANGPGCRRRRYRWTSSGHPRRRRGIRKHVLAHDTAVSSGTRITRRARVRVTPEAGSPHGSLSGGEPASLSLIAGRRKCWASFPC